MNKKQFTFRILLTLCLTLTFAGLTGPAAPVQGAQYNDIPVTTTDDELNSDGDCSLREAIQTANTDSDVDACETGVGIDRIQLPAGTYTLDLVGAGEDLNATGDLDILDSGDLVIQGDGAGVTVIDGNNSDRVFHICPSGGCDNAVTINNVMIRNGQVTLSGGGGIRNEGASTTLDASSVISNTALNGGGIANFAALHIQNGSTIGESGAGNAATLGNGGGIYNYTGDTTLDASSVISNTAANNGGGIFVYAGTTTVSASTVVSNTAANNGGGIHNLATLSVQNGSIISNNAAQGNDSEEGGGGIYNAAGTTTVDGSSISANTARDGGGIYHAAGTTTVDGSTVSANIATRYAGYGGGILNWSGTLSVQNGSTIGGAYMGNQAYYGGGIFTAGITTVDGSAVSANTANRYGGGIFNQATLNVQNGSTISNNNAAAHSGGGIYNTGDTIVTGSRILFNTAGDDGGGVFNDADSTEATDVTGSCIVGNSDTSFFNNQTAEQIATGNWWGAVSGSSGTGPGTGDSVSANVDYSGFLTTPILGCGPDLQVNKTNDTDGEARVGTPFTWTLTISNTGIEDVVFVAGQTILQDDLPSGPTYGTPVVTHAISVTNSAEIHCGITSNTLTCETTNNDLILVVLGAATGSSEVAFSVTPTASGTLTNPRGGGVCQVDPDGYVGESNETNNECPVNSVNVTAPSIAVSKQANVDSARVGGTITYTYRVTNTGDTVLNGIVANDDRLGMVPLGATSLVPGGGTSGTLTYTVVAEDLPGPLTNTVTITGSPPAGSAVTANAYESVSITSAFRIYLPLVVRSY